MVQPTNKRFLLESDKGIASGLATLDAGAKLPAGQLPATAATLDGVSGRILEAQLPDRLLDAGLKAIFAVKAAASLNILDFAVTRGTTASQTAAIKAALDANPGKQFYFPPGDYRLDTKLTINNGNSLLLDRDARIYAGAAMTTLIEYAWTGTGYAEDKAIYGGLLDGNLNAGTILTIQKVIHFTLAHTLFRDGINRGLQTVAGLGAELIAYDLRFWNTGTTNVTDNIAIESNMGDSHFRDIIIRDWTVAVKDTSANRWDRVHPWISQDTGAAPQMTNRYPSSIGFDITGASDIVSCVTDTYRYAYKFRSNGTSYTAPARLTNCRAMWANDPILTNAIATANPAYVFDNADGIGAIVDKQTVTGHSTVPGNFLTGPTTNLTTRNTYNYGYIKGAQGTVADPLDYLGGIQQGTFTFTPTIYGANSAGTHTYSSRSGRMVVAGDMTTYFIRIAGTLDATTGFQGAVRLGGIPVPNGATNVRDGAGSVGYATNIPAAGACIFANTAPYVTLTKLDPLVGMAEIDVAGQSMRGKVIDLMVTIRVTHYKA